MEKFNSLLKGKKEEKKQNNKVWIYTRVSSKDQEMNKSLENQKESGYKYAKRSWLFYYQYFWRNL